MARKVEIVTEDIGDSDRKDVVFHLNLLASKYTLETFHSESDARTYAEENSLEIVEL